MLGRSPRGPLPAIAASLALLLVAAPARAEDAPAAPEVPASPDISTKAAPLPPELTDVTFASVALTATGFLTAFVVHEACHAVANLAFGNVPTLEPVRFLGVVPFFAISPGIQCRGGTCTKRSGAPFYPGPRG